MHEALGLLRSVQSLPTLLAPGKRIRAVVDNQPLYFNWCGGSHHPNVCAVLKEMWELVHSADALLALSWVPLRFSVGAVGTIVCPTQVTVGHIEHRMNAYQGGWVGTKGGRPCWPGRSKGPNELRASPGGRVH